MNKNHDPKTGKFSSGGGLRKGAVVKPIFRNPTTGAITGTGKDMKVRGVMKDGVGFGTGNYRVVPQKLDKMRGAEAKAALRLDRAGKAPADRHGVFKKQQTVQGADGPIKAFSKVHAENIEGVRVIVRDKKIGNALQRLNKALYGVGGDHVGKKAKKNADGSFSGSAFNRHGVRVKMRVPGSDR